MVALEDLNGSWESSLGRTGLCARAACIKVQRPGGKKQLGGWDSETGKRARAGRKLKEVIAEAVERGSRSQH